MTSFFVPDALKSHTRSVTFCSSVNPAQAILAPALSQTSDLVLVFVFALCFDCARCSQFVTSFFFGSKFPQVQSYEIKSFISQVSSQSQLRKSSQTRSYNSARVLDNSSSWFLSLAAQQPQSRNLATDHVAESSH